MRITQEFKKQQALSNLKKALYKFWICLLYAIAYLVVLTFIWKFVSFEPAVIVGLALILSHLDTEAHIARKEKEQVIK